MSMTADEAYRALTQPGAPFELEERDVRGVRLRCWKNAPHTLREIVVHGRGFGRREYLVYEDERLSYEESFARIAALAQHLAVDLGLRKGDRVALAMRNYPEWVIAFWAVAALGCVVVPLNAWWQGEELAYALRDSGARILICDLERHERIAGHALGLPLEATLVARAGNALPHGCRALEALLTPSGAPPELPAAELDADDDATIFYTSGTTGHPKGALGTHRNLITALTNVAYARARAALRKGVALPSASQAPSSQTVTLLTVPLFHVMGCHSSLAYNTAYGGKIVMMHKWDPERALELIERERITSVGGAPGMIFQLVDSKDFGLRDISSVTSVSLGGAPSAPELMRRIKRALPVATPSNGYGLTESSALAISNAGIDYEQKPDSIGLPLPVCDAKVMSEDGRELARGESGELWIRGPNIVRGYFGNASATAQSFSDGWLHTGDIVKMDEAGFIYLLDRQKDMLIRGGENVYCVEVENVLYQHPEVIDAAVIGVPHAVLGEEVAAIVQRKAGSKLDANGLRAYVAQHLAAFKVPTHVFFRDEPLPRNPNGKVLKQQLKAELDPATEAD